jgi:hypothetical protein
MAHGRGQGARAPVCGFRPGTGEEPCVTYQQIKKGKDIMASLRGISCVTLRMEYQKPVVGLLTVARKDTPRLPGY